MNPLHHKPLVILITGGSRGIGAAIADHLRYKGHHVIATHRAASVVQTGQQPGLLQLEVGDAASVAACVQNVLQKCGRIDVLVNNAGFDLYGALTETPWTEFDRQMDINFMGAARMTQAVLPTMLSQGSGRIVNMGSLGGQVGLPMNSAYTASKFALEGFGESLRLELAPRGIHVSTIVPGPVATDTLDRSIQEVPQTGGAFAERHVVMLRRMREDGARSAVKPHHVAEAVARAIEANVPRKHYPVGALATWVPRLKAWLPAAWFEAFMRRSFP
jgi:NAD(P)-dependent dehydrogenase (short-subunit alcohol dehydrogenase family)